MVTGVNLSKKLEGPALPSLPFPSSSPTGSGVVMIFIVVAIKILRNKQSEF